MHAFKAGEHCVPYSRCAELGYIPTQSLCFYLRKGLILQQNIHKTVARKLIRLELMPL